MEGLSCRGNDKGYGQNMLIDCMMADIAEVLSYLPTAILVGAAYALVAGIDRVRRMF